MSKRHFSFAFVPTNLVRVFHWFDLRMRRNSWLNLVLHSLGLSSLGGALFLQASVFGGIIQSGYFRGIEQNPVALYSEVALTAIGIAYFAYLLVRFVLSSSHFQTCQVSG